MAEINSNKILKDTIRRISIESPLRESEAFEIIKSGMIFPEWLDFFAPKIIELANKGGKIEIIKIEVYSLMTQISVAGGLENYKLLKRLS
jgi:hypothetical protein